jgi:GT2 family glycosyltransferase
MKICIGIATYISNDIQREFTEMTIKSIQTKHEVLVCIVQTYAEEEQQNKLQEFLEEQKLKYIYFKSDRNSVSKAWNQAIIHGTMNGFDYILIPNNDIIFRSDCIDNLVQFAETHPEFIMWTANSYAVKNKLEEVEINDSFDEAPHFSCFMVKNDFINRFREKELGTKEPVPGLFDDQFQMAYFEDNDMHNRILRAGFKAGKTASALFYHFGSRTIKTDNELNYKNGFSYENNRMYFVRKWGWDPQYKPLTNDDPLRYEYKGPFEPVESFGPQPEPKGGI